MFLTKHFRTLVYLFVILTLSACSGGGGSTSTTDVDTSQFNGIWYSPCFNNSFDFSARQKITINGTSLISNIETHANAPAVTLDCGLSAEQLTIGDITATLGYGNNFQESSCVNNTGIDSSITLISNNTSGSLINTQPEVTNSIELLTGRKDDFLPTSSVICLKPNGNLSFAGYEYTRDINTSIIDIDNVVAAPPSTEVTWKVGNFNYSGGTASGSSASQTTCTGVSCPNVDNLGVLTVGTSGFDTTNGAYSGSTITISHTLKGAGTYSLGDTPYLLEDDLSNKRMKLDIIVGTSVTSGATGYDATSGNVIVTVDNDGKYHFTIAPSIQLTKTIDVLTGVLNAPETIAFSMNNIHDHNP